MSHPHSNQNSDKQSKKEEFSQEIIDLVVARLETIPSNTKISIGGDGDFGINDLIERVKANDEIGKKIIKIQLEYIRALKNLLQPEDVVVNN